MLRLSQPRECCILESYFVSIVSIVETTRPSHNANSFRMSRSSGDTPSKSPVQNFSSPRLLTNLCLQEKNAYFEEIVTSIRSDVCTRFAAAANLDKSLKDAALIKISCLGSGNVAPVHGFLPPVLLAAHSRLMRELLPEADSDVTILLPGVSSACEEMLLCFLYFGR